MKLKQPFLAAILALAICDFSLSAAQADKDIPSASPKAADEEWQALKELGHGASSKADLLRDADRLKAFYTKHAAHAEAKNAKCLEGILLLQAWLADDTSQDARRQQVVGEMRHNKSVSRPLRAHLFALADHALIAKRRDLSREGKMLAYEQAVRALITEFPELPNGYESLMYIARDSTEAKGAALAREVATLSGTPAWVKAEAQAVIDRFALVGSMLPESATAHLKAENAGMRKRPVVIYSWSASNPASILRAKAMAAKAPAEATLLGVCLDADIGAAKLRASADALPGSQIYDALGLDSAVARDLKFTEPGLVYAADSSGIIRTVSAHTRLDSSALFADL